MARFVEDAKRVFLGFVDEKITEKFESGVDFMTSKIGGSANWILNSPSNTNCAACNVEMKLITQIYAPLENSVYHRTLYVFACTQPDCWNIAKSWKCFRGQSVDRRYLAESNQKEATHSAKPSDWLADADDWGDEENIDDNNGNMLKPLEKFDEMTIGQQISSSSDDLSPSADDPNANQLVSEFSGAEGGDGYTCPTASAEVEVEDDQDLNELVAAESPKTLAKFLSENETSIPVMFFKEKRTNIAVNFSSASLISFFLSVAIEDSRYLSTPGLSDHERHLLEEYSKMEDHNEKVKGALGSDVYEKSKPKHGDVWFHKFTNVIRKNPGQVIRYTRDENCCPLFVSPPDKSTLPQFCSYCKGPVICELQILPTLIPSLHFEQDSSCSTPIEFGSVFVFSCLKSCWEDGDACSAYKLEQIILQNETF